ncbi:zinc ribbon domain-containing protein [Tissierella carlieri]|uniref:Zinc ribbon domain-containing protein n=1 Tax=Tissierella carlieri TaxID=689904 RepID=A0ABT1SE23_9FIRM|nr:zinc ribbon domain-containing protein [Tissierella carlieri]MBU5313483.1 zinc ribbon domain-containing protein [Tissierella carlieri]MCQ4924728.1 zinc ribbon domain-containing protein [Tissierella carlieri]
MNSYEIAYKLSKKQIPDPRGGIWYGTTEFEVLPKSEWVIVNNCHEAVKTQVEHEKILIFLNRLKRTKRSVGKKLPFTGLIKCGKCNHTLSIIERKDRKGTLTIQTCWYKDEFGNKCGNSGGLLQLIYDVVNRELENYEIKIQNEVDKDADAEINEITNMISTYESTIKLKLNSITRIRQAYEAEAYTLDEYKIRKKTVTKEIHLLEDELKVLKYRLKHAKSLTNQQRMNLIYEFKKIIKSENLTYEEQNELYKSIIESIVWKREGDNIEIEVNFI